MESNIVRVECIIRGRVQMVLYRDFVLRHALRLHIVGRIKNEADGSVSVVAEGESQHIAQLLELLHKGSMLSKVENIDIHYRKITGEFNSFTIA